MSKFELLPIELRVRTVLCDFLDEEDRLIVGISGGADSVALLSMLARMNWPVHAVHINYQARGKESEKDQEFVELLCQHLQVDLTVKQFPKSAAQGNFQNWARGKRYEVFREKLQDAKACGIAVAHHREDQLETILQKILRGAGPDRWEGMNYWNGEIIRPLLDYSKQDILVYLDNIGQRYRTDSSNKETSYARNFLRHEWLPELNRFFPGWQDNLQRLGDYSSQFEQSQQWILEHVVQDSALKRDPWIAMPQQLRVGILRQWVREQTGLDVISHGQLLEWIDALPQMQVGQYVAINDLLGIWVERGRFRISEIDLAQNSRAPRVVDLNSLPNSLDDVVFAEEQLTPSEWMDYLCLDIDKLSDTLIMRNWRPGDRIQPLGMDGQKKISDVLTDAKIPSHNRAKAKVILTFEETICAVIFPPIQNSPMTGVIAEPYKCDQNTATCLVIQKTDIDR